MDIGSEYDRLNETCALAWQMRDWDEVARVQDEIDRL